MHKIHKFYWTYSITKHIIEEYLTLQILSGYSQSERCYLSVNDGRTFVFLLTYIASDNSTTNKILRRLLNEGFKNIFTKMFKHPDQQLENTKV